MWDAYFGFGYLLWDWLLITSDKVVRAFEDVRVCPECRVVGLCQNIATGVTVTYLIKVEPVVSNDHTNSCEFNIPICIV